MGSEKQLMASFITAMLALGLMLISTSSRADNPPGMEKCYGIAKAGQNDCDSGPGTGACIKSVIDADPNYWIYVPTGVCDKIFGGLSKDLAGMGTGNSSNAATSAVGGAVDTTSTAVVNPAPISTVNGNQTPNIPANSPGPGLDSNFMIQEPKNTP